MAAFNKKKYLLVSTSYQYYYSFLKRGSGTGVFL